MSSRKLLVQTVMRLSKRYASLRRFAYDLDVSVQTVNNWLSGKTEPKAKHVLALAKMDEPDDVKARWALAEKLAGLDE